MIDCDVHAEMERPRGRPRIRRAGPARLVPGAGAARSVCPGTRGCTRTRSTGRISAEPGGSPARAASRRTPRRPGGLGVDVGILNADEAVTVSLMASPSRAAELRGPITTGSASAGSTRSPGCAGGSSARRRIHRRQRRRSAESPGMRASSTSCSWAAPSGPTATRATCRSSRRPSSAGFPWRSTRAGREWGWRRRRAVRGCRRTTSNGTRSARRAASWPTSSHSSSTASSTPAGAEGAAPEGGLAWLPGILWRLDGNWRGLRADTPWLTRKPSEVVRERIRFTTQPLEHTDGKDDLLFEMLEATGAPDNLCFATDYPHWDFDDPAFMLRRLPEGWREKVMHENAVAFYGERLMVDRKSGARRAINSGSIIWTRHCVTSGWASAPARISSTSGSRSSGTGSPSPQNGTTRRTRS